MTKDSCELLARIGTALYDPDVLTRQDADALYTALDALVAEVERLRYALDIERAAARTTSADNLDTLQAGYADGVDDERAAVVAWLHTEADKWLDGEAPLLLLAREIGRGEHRAEEER